MSVGRKRTIDSGRRDTLGRTIKISGFCRDETLNSDTRAALREKDIITKRTKPTSRKLTGRARKYLKYSKKAIIVGTVAALSLGMTACSSSEIIDRLTEQPITNR